MNKLNFSFSKDLFAKLKSTGSPKGAKKECFVKSLCYPRFISSARNSPRDRKLRKKKTKVLRKEE